MRRLPPRPFGLLVSLLALSSFSGAAAAQTQLFDGNAYLPIGFSGPNISFGSGVLADLNQDGTSDLIISDRANNRIEVRIGLGSGNFASPQYYDAGDFPYDLAAGDVTGDGHVDVVLTNLFANTLSVFPGNGDGSLGTPIVLPTITSPYQVTLADFDQDGRLDMVVACNAGTDRLCLFRALPGGTFAPRVDVTTGVEPIATAVADINGDSKVDLLASCDNGVAVHLGLGGGSFAPMTLLDASGTHGPIAASDVDGDGDLDLIVASGRDSGYAVTILRNGGAGNFEPPHRLGYGYYSYGLAVLDLDSKSPPEILTINPDAHTLSVLTSTDGYHTATQRSFPVAFYPQAMTVGDLDGDGVDDVCIGGLESFLSIVKGNGDGTMGAFRGFPSGPHPYQVASADLNHDGNPDLVLSHGDGNFRVQLGTAAGGFAPPSLVGLSGSIFKLARFNGDDEPDMLVVSDESLSAALGQGNGTFSPSASIPLENRQRTGDVGDVNGDGKTDAVTMTEAGIYGSPPGEVSVFFGRGDGTFDPTPVTSLPNANGWAGLTTADFNGDGKLDLALTAFDDTVRVFLGAGDGTFVPSTAIAYGQGYVAARAVQWNSDSWPDLVIEDGNGNLQIFLGKGTGEFTPGPSQHLFDFSFWMDADQIDGVAGKDLVLVSDHGLIEVLRGDESGEFASVSLAGTCGIPGGLALADMNRDGKLDLVVPCQIGDEIAVLLNTSDNSTPALLSPGSITVGQDMVRLEWLGTDAQSLSARVERREPQEPGWTPLGRPSSPTPNELAYEDRSVKAGHRYGYRLAIEGNSSTTYTQESWVEIPSGAFLALEAIRPNPSSRNGVAFISVSLASHEPAALRLVTIQGRVLRDMAISSPGPGRRTIPFTRAWGVSPGVYFLQLSQGSASSVQRIVVAP